MKNSQPLIIKSMRNHLTTFYSKISDYAFKTSQLMSGNIIKM